MRKLRLMPAPVANEDGVCSGIAYWIGIQTSIVRGVFLLGLIASGASIIVYRILSEVLNEWNEIPEDYEEVTDDRNT